MKTSARIFYATLAYLVGLGGLSYFVLFLGGWDFLPAHVDSGTPGSLAIALPIDIGLILLFGLQHSVMARPSFKKKWTQLIPHDLERLTYVLASGIFMFVIALFWQPLPGSVWAIDTALRFVLIGVYVAGFFVMVSSSFIINHFELFGLQQVYDRITGKERPEEEFKEALYYRVVRHPIQVGVLMCLWATPDMSVSHLVLAITMSAYIFVGLYFEERDLVRKHGDQYRDYQRRVNKLLPAPKLAANKTFAPSAISAAQ